MTKMELAKMLGSDISFLNKAFKKAEKLSPSIKAKSKHFSNTIVTNYTLTECYCALQFLPWDTPMVRLYLKENFKDPSGTYVHHLPKRSLSTDLRLFIFLYTHTRGHRKVCATCNYLVARRTQLLNKDKPSTRCEPFCKFYNSFMNRAKNRLNIYKDRCETYSWSHAAPLVFDNNHPKNVDINGNLINCTLGIDNSEFKSKKRGEPVVLLDEVKTI